MIGSWITFLFQLQGHSVNRKQDDRLVWKGDGKGRFSVEALYSLLELDSATPFLVGVIWNSWVPSKVSFFALESYWGKVLTLDQFQRRGWSLVNRCTLCKEESESIDYILLHCAKARILWLLVLSLFGIPWVIFASVWDTLLVWQGSFVERSSRKAWRVAPLCIFWTI